MRNDWDAMEQMVDDFTRAASIELRDEKRSRRHRLSKARSYLDDAIEQIEMMEDEIMEDC